MTLEEIEIRLRNVEERLKTTEDIEAIKQLHYRYVNCLNFAQWGELMDCFSENSAVDFPSLGLNKGKTQIAKLFKEQIPKVHVGKEGDFIVHPFIYVDGDRAKGNWLIYMMHAHPSTWQSLFWVQGIYDAEYVKENGNWKFSFLKCRFRLEPPGGPPDPNYLKNFLKK